MTATLSAPGHSIGGTSIGVSVATNWSTTTGIHFSIYATTTVGSLTVKDTSTQTDWKGTLSGTTISNMTITGGTDQDYSAGAIVEITPTARWAKDLYDWAIAQHKQDGTHAAITATSVNVTAGNAVTTDVISEKTSANGVTIDGMNIKDSAITTAASVPSESLNATIACRAYRNAAFNVTGGGGPEKLILDTESYDTGSDWDTTNGRFTAPVTGYYQVNANLALLNAGDAGFSELSIYVNGAPYSHARSISASAGGDPVVNCSDLVYITAGQYIEMYVDTLNTSAITTGATATYMSIYFVGV